MHAPSISEIQNRLRQHRAVRVDPSRARSWASVALILRKADGEDSGLELLFIRRAVKAGDPWSGHMAFPGGRQEPRDETLYATAVRETAEEVGLDLTSSASFIAPLDDQISPLREGHHALAIRPQVFLSRDLPKLMPNEEVQRCYWFSLSSLLDPRHRETMPYHWKGSRLQLPVIRIDDADIWGLSLRMWDSFVRVVWNRHPEAV